MLQRLSARDAALELKGLQRERARGAWITAPVLEMHRQGIGRLAHYVWRAAAKVDDLSPSASRLFIQPLTPRQQCVRAQRFGHNRRPAPIEMF